jgi:spermidine synthase
VWRVFDAAALARLLTVWEVIDNAATVDGDDLVLSRLGDEWQVHTGPSLLMSSDDHHSEELLAELAVKKAGAVRRVLVGGLGMGFTLRATLERLSSDAEVVLAETSSALVRWNRTCLADLAGRPLEDPRVRLEMGDVADRIADANADYDVILLDVDNGPHALVHASNDRLYGPEGSRAALRSLRPGGVLAVWGRWPDDSYVERLRAVGFEAEAVPVLGLDEDMPTHTVFMATRQLQPSGRAEPAG